MMKLRLRKGIKIQVISEDLVEIRLRKKPHVQLGTSITSPGAGDMKILKINACNL